MQRRAINRDRALKGVSTVAMYVSGVLDSGTKRGSSPMLFDKVDKLLSVCGAYASETLGSILFGNRSIGMS